MKPQTQLKNSIEMLKLLLALSALVVVVAGCTKSRDTEFADEKSGLEVISIAELQNQSFTLGTGSIDEDSNAELKAAAVPSLEKPLVKVSQNTAPAKLADLLTNISIVGQENQQIDVKLEVSSKAVDVLAVYDSIEGLTTLEKAMATKSQGKFLVPLVRIPIKAYGILENIKNENKEKTSKIQLAPSKFEAATHIQLDLNKDSLAQPLQIEAEKLRTELFAKDEVSGSSFEISTGPISAGELQAIQDNVGRFASVAASKIISSSAPAKLSNLLVGQTISAPAGATIKAKVVPSRAGLVILRQVENLNQLSEAQRNLARPIDGKNYVHLGTVKVKQAGQIFHLVNAQNEPLRQIEVRETDFAAASHLIVNLNADSFAGLWETLGSQQSLKSLYLRADIDQKVFTFAQLEEIFKFQTPKEKKAKVFISVEKDKGSSLTAKMFQIMTSEKLKALDKDAYDSLKSGHSKKIFFCSAEIKKQLPEDEQVDCVIVLKFAASIDNVAVKQSLGDQGEASFSDLEIEEEDSSRPTAYVQIPQHLPVTEIKPKDINAYNSLEVKEGQEYLFRRTMADSSISSILAPGFSGELSIVTFQFTRDNKLVIRNADSAKAGGNSSAIDREPLLVIPVTYLKANSNPGSTEPFEEALRSEAKWAVLDWSNNQVGTNNSPVSWLNSCFTNQAETEITNVDNRMSKEGILNFTLSRTASLSDVCLSPYNLNDYWWASGTQSTMTFEERVSFKAYDKGANETPALDLPFRAQNLMGFGAFTAGKLKPDDFGNTGRIDNEVSLPLTHDFSDGKKLVYVLGGLPGDGWMREALIEATQEVVADWNATLKYAFKHTPLERADDYVELKIDGQGISEGGLGDLDRNYIWNYTRAMDSGPLGLSIAGPNPRSGKVEHNNVLMYSGNLWQMVGYMKQNAIAQKNYEDMKAAALEEAKKKTQTPAVADVPAIETESGLTIDDGELEGATAGKFTPNSNQDKKQFRSEARHLRIAPSDLSSAQEERHLKLNQSMQDRSNAYLHRIMKKALEQNAAKDPNMLNALSAAEVLKTFGNRLSPVEKAALVAQTKRLALTAELDKHLRKVGGCLLTKSSATLTGDFDWVNGDPKTIFKSQYKFTLSHEIGHSLGLTHNFIASADKKNFEYKGQELGRRYSSVMDYLPDDSISYKGLGPYDAHALRATHTQYLELSEEALAKVADGLLSAQSVTGEKIQVPVKGGNLIHLDDVKKIALGKQSWWNLNQANLALVGLKKYQYCSDNEADGNGSPLCNRWDAGGSPLEVAQYYAEQYRANYPLLNHRGNRINIVSFGGYVGRLFSTMLPIRFFNEEIFYQLITRSFSSEEELYDHFYAALSAQSFFFEVVGTPTVTKSFSDTSRLVPFTYTYEEADGSGGVVEKQALTIVEHKSNSDLGAPGTPQVTDTRGIEVDKAIALMMLTQRDMGHPRYSANSIRFSFAELEALVLGRNTVQSNMTLQLLHRIVADNPITVTNTPHGPQILPTSFKAETSDLVRYYALLGSNAFLDSDSLTNEGNMASRFHTGSTKQNLQDRFQVSKLDEALNSTQVLKFHALDGAASSEELVRRAAQKRAVIDVKNALAENYKAIFTLQAQAAAEQETEKKAQAEKEAGAKVAELVTKIKSLNSKGLIVNDQERAAQLTEELLVNASLQFAGNILKVVEANWQAFAMFPDMIAQMLEPTKNSNEASAKGVLFLNAIGAKGLEALYADLSVDGITDPAEVEKIEQENAILAVKRNFVNALIDTSVLESNHGMVVGNLQRQNQLLEVMYPEKNR
jgi:hypothetical protein